MAACRDAELPLVALHRPVPFVEVTEAIQEPLRLIVGAIRDVLEETPPELAADIFDRGIVLSGGLALTANAHVVVAAQGTSFGLTDIREGRWSEAFADAIGHAIGERRALELALSGRIFPTPEALAWGLVHHVAPAFELEDRAMEVATGIANANPEAIRAMLKI